MVLVDHQAAVERWISAPVALQAVAEAAIDADLERRIRIRRQLAIGVNHLPRLARLAAYGDDKLLRRHVMTTARA